MSALSKTSASWQFRRLLKIRQRYQTSAKFDGQQLKNERKVSGTSHRNELFLRIMHAGHMFRLRDVRQGTYT